VQATIGREAFPDAAVVDLGAAVLDDLAGILAGHFVRVALTGIASSGSG
jgi:hypothetical protein